MSLTEHQIEECVQDLFHLLYTSYGYDKLWNTDETDCVKTFLEKKKLSLSEKADDKDREEIVKRVKAYKPEYTRKANRMTLEQAVQKHCKENINTFWKLLGFKLDSPPPVCIGPSTSTGHLKTGAVLTIIYLDPTKNKSPLEYLKTLLFETINALQKPKYDGIIKTCTTPNQMGNKHVEIEFRTSELERDMILRREKVMKEGGKDWKGAVVELAQTWKLLQYVASKYRTGPLPQSESPSKLMPAKSVLQKQDHRTVLRWFLYSKWQGKALDDYKNSPHVPNAKLTTLQKEVANYVEKGAQLKEFKKKSGY